MEPLDPMTASLFAIYAAKSSVVAPSRLTQDPARLGSNAPAIQDGPVPPLAPAPADGVGIFIDIVC